MRVAAFVAMVPWLAASSVACGHAPARMEPVAGAPAKARASATVDAPTHAPSGEIDVSVLALDGGYLHAIDGELLRGCRTRPVVGWILYAADRGKSPASLSIRDRLGIPDDVAGCVATKLGTASYETADDVLVYVALR